MLSRPLKIVDIGVCTVLVVFEVLVAVSPEFRNHVLTNLNAYLPIALEAGFILYAWHRVAERGLPKALHGIADDIALAGRDPDRTAADVTSEILPDGSWDTS